MSRITAAPAGRSFTVDIFIEYLRPKPTVSVSRSLIGEEKAACAHGSSASVGMVSWECCVPGMNRVGCERSTRVRPGDTTQEGVGAGILPRPGLSRG